MNATPLPKWEPYTTPSGHTGTVFHTPDGWHHAVSDTVEQLQARGMLDMLYDAYTAQSHRAG